MMGCWRFACFEPTPGAAAVSEKFITAILSAASTHCQRFELLTELTVPISH